MAAASEPSVTGDPAGPPPAGQSRVGEAYAAFVSAHVRGLSRLAFLLVGDEYAAEDLTAEVFLDAWRQWERVSGARHPVAYLRQMMVNKAAAHVRRLVHERQGLDRLQEQLPVGVHDPDSAAVVDVRSLLARLPPGRRACLVLRFGFDLTEREVAATLGVSVGTVKSQTSKAVSQFRREAGSGQLDGYGAAGTATSADAAGERGSHAR